MSWTFNPCFWLLLPANTPWGEPLLPLSPVSVPPYLSYPPPPSPSHYCLHYLLRNNVSSLPSAATTPTVLLPHTRPHATRSPGSSWIRASSDPVRFLPSWWMASVNLTDYHWIAHLGPWHWDSEMTRNAGHWEGLEVKWQRRVIWHWHLHGAIKRQEEKRGDKRRN